MMCELSSVHLMSLRSVSGMIGVRTVISALASSRSVSGMNGVR